VSGRNMYEVVRKNYFINVYFVGITNILYIFRGVCLKSNYLVLCSAGTWIGSRTDNQVS